MKARLGDLLDHVQRNTYGLDCTLHLAKTNQASSIGYRIHGSWIFSLIRDSGLQHLRQDIPFRGLCIASRSCNASQSFDNKVDVSLEIDCDAFQHF